MILNLKNILIATLLFAMSVNTIAQKKDLTIEDCELGYYKGLYPERLSALQWLPDGLSYSYNSGDSIVIANLKGKKKYISKATLLKADSTLKYMPYVTWQDPETFIYFSNGKYKKYNISKKIGTTLVSVPAEDVNMDRHSKNYQVAYTIDNNLYLATSRKEKAVVSKSSDKNIVSGQAIHRFEFGISKETFWSTKGNV